MASRPCFDAEIGGRPQRIASSSSRLRDLVAPCRGCSSNSTGMRFRSNGLVVTVDAESSFAISTLHADFGLVRIVVSRSEYRTTINGRAPIVNPNLYSSSRAAVDPHKVD